MIQQYFRGAERGRAFGYFGSVVGVAVGIGPVLGGFLVNLGGPHFGWRLTFLVNVPIGILCLVLAFLWFPRPLFSRLRNAASKTANGAGQGLRSLDPVGSLLLGLAVLAILFPFVEHGVSTLIWLLLPAGIGLVFVWVRWERRYRDTGRSPMVDLNIFSTRSFSNGSTIVTLYFMGMTSTWVLVPQYLQEGLGKTALVAGAFGIPSALISAIAANWAGKRVATYGRKIVIGGLLFAIAGLILSIGVVVAHEAGYLSIWWLPLTLAFIGVAQGSVISPNQTLTLADVPIPYAGSSGAIMQTGQRIGTSIGIAVITSAVFATVASSSWATAVPVGFGLIGVMVLLTLGVALKDQHDRVQAARQDSAVSGEVR
jgi:MFS family permease